MSKKRVSENKKENSVVEQRAREGVLSASDVEKVCVVFRILADPTRMKIVMGLMQGDMCVNRLLGICGGTQSAISHQLRVLRDNKIVTAKRMGQNVEYSIADMHVHKIVEMSIAHLYCADEFGEG